MSLRIRDQLVTARTRTWPGVNRKTSITVHETANTSRGANAAAHANLQSRGNVRQASWHIQVDDREAVRSFPDDVRCWHAGPDAADSLSLEICVNADGDYDKALANAAEVVKAWRAKYGLGRDAVRQHYHWTGKNCPTRLRAAGRWAQFVAATDPDTTATPPKVGPVGKTVAGGGGGKSITAMAAEVIAGKHGNGHETRRKSLGISAALYEQVRAEVNRRAGAPTTTPRPAPARPNANTIARMAQEVIDGRHGTGHATRQRSLGVSSTVYAQVRAEVNRRLLGGTGPAPATRHTKTITQMADEILRGLHGNGHETRRRSLGIDHATYARVRAEVNRRA